MSSTPLFARLRPSILGARSPIGIDFDGERIHWVQLEGAGTTLRLRDACSVRHDGDLEALLSSKSELKQLVSTVFRRSRFKGRRIVTAPPSKHLRLMVLNYSADDGLSEPAQILGLVRERMREDLRDHVVDYTPIRTSGNKQGDRSALVAVAPEAPVVEHLERLRQVGLEVDALEIGPLAIRRLVASMLPPGEPLDDPALALVLRMGPETTELTLIAGRRLLLYREIDVGTSSLVEAVAKGLDCDRDAALELIGTFGVGPGSAGEGARLEFVGEAPAGTDGTEEISATLREILRPGLRALVEQAHKAISYAAFQTRGTSIERVQLLEGSFACPGLDGLLADMLQLPVAFFRPMQRFQDAGRADSGPSDARLAVALGFALRGLANV